MLSKYYESSQRGVRKNYTPYGTSKLAHIELSKVRDEAETNFSKESNIQLQEKKAKFLRTKLELKGKKLKRKNCKP